MNSKINMEKLGNIAKVQQKHGTMLKAGQANSITKDMTKTAVGTSLNKVITTQENGITTGISGVTDNTYDEEIDNPVTMFSGATIENRKTALWRVYKDGTQIIMLSQYSRLVMGTGGYQFQRDEFGSWINVATIEQTYDEAEFLTGRIVFNVISEIINVDYNVIYNHFGINTNIYGSVYVLRMQGDDLILSPPKSNGRVVVNRANIPSAQIGNSGLLTGDIYKDNNGFIKIKGTNAGEAINASVGLKIPTYSAQTPPPFSPSETNICINTYPGGNGIWVHNGTAWKSVTVS